MRRLGRESWQMNINFPMLMQFAAYIGQHQGFTTSVNASPSSHTKQEWREWWDSLPAVLSGVHDEIGRAHKLGQRPPLPAIMTFALDPPEFERMADRPELQRLCRSYWDAFHPEWNREKMRLARQPFDLHRAVNAQQIVKECSRQAGHKPRPFRLRLDFTRWPTDYQRSVSGNHLVLGTGYLDDAKIDDLRTLLRSYIARLV